MNIWQYLEQQISQQTESPFKIQHKQSIFGGDINQAYKLSDEKRCYFVKTNDEAQLPLFEAEIIALKEIQQSCTIQVPKALVCGVYGKQSYLVLEFVGMQEAASNVLFGEKLAQLHLYQASRFGFQMDNYIGTTLQTNSWSDDWITFWQQQRLMPQLMLCKQNGYSGQLIDKGLELIEKTPYFFQSYQPKASLLHGDLWSGNYSSTLFGQPIIYDPASYYGDHEVDLAMTELFGHPSHDFYSRYQEIYPLDDGFNERKLFYNVYHILNHANLFGGGYQQQAINSIERLLQA